MNPTTLFARPVKYSYTIACFPALWNPNIKTALLPREDLNLADITRKLKERDEIGRGLMLGIYQEFDTKTEEEKAYTLFRSRVADRMVDMLGLQDHIHRNLICVAYDPEPDKDKPKLNPKQKRAIREIEKMAREVTRALGEKEEVREEIEMTKEKLAELTSWYIAQDDSLGRLALCSVDALPSFYEKDTASIYQFSKRLTEWNALGNDMFNDGLVAETQEIVKRQELARRTFGLTRDEMTMLYPAKMALAEHIRKQN